MPTRLRKIRKHRGSRSHGWGQSAGHRGAGSRGGHGKAGGHKHHWTYTVSYEPDRYGKHGFFRKSDKIMTINVGELNLLADKLISVGRATKKDAGTIIDLNAMGIEKLLGSGKVDKKFIIRVKAFSAKAAEKVQKAKGQILSID